MAGCYAKYCLDMLGWKMGLGGDLLEGELVGGWLKWNDDPNLPHYLLFKKDVLYSSICFDLTICKESKKLFPFFSLAGKVITHLFPIFISISIYHVFTVL